MANGRTEGRKEYHVGGPQGTESANARCVLLVGYTCIICQHSRSVASCENKLPFISHLIPCFQILVTLIHSSVNIYLWFRDFLGNLVVMKDPIFQAAQAGAVIFQAIRSLD